MAGDQIVPHIHEQNNIDRNDCRSPAGHNENTNPATVAATTSHAPLLIDHQPSSSATDALPRDTAPTYDQCLQLISGGGDGGGAHRFHWLLLLGTGVACMSVLIEDNCMAFVLPAARCALRISVRQQGALYVATTAGFVCAAPLWGFIADTWGRRNVLRTALALSSCASAVSAAAPDAGWLMAGRFVVGLCVAGVKGTAMSYVAEFHGGGDGAGRRRPMHLALLSSAMWTTALLQPLVAWAVFGDAETDTETAETPAIAAWRVFILLGSGWSALGAVVMTVLPESPKFLLAVGRPEEALRVLATVWKVNGGGGDGKRAYRFAVERLAPLEAGVSGSGGLASVRSAPDVCRLIWAQLRPLLRRPYRSDLLLCCTFAFGTFFVCHGWLLWFPQLLAIYTQGQQQPHQTTCVTLNAEFVRTIERNTVNTTLAAAAAVPALCTSTLNWSSLHVSMSLGVFLVTINTAIGLAIHYVRPKYLQVAWFLSAAIAALVLLQNTQFHLNVGCMIVIVSTACSFASMCGVFGDLFPTHLRSMSLNLVMMCGRLGGVAGTNTMALAIFWRCADVLLLQAALLAGSALGIWMICVKCERKQNVVH